MNILKNDNEQRKIVNKRGLNFTVFVRTPKRDVLVSRKRADLQGGKPLESFTDKEFSLMNAVSIVDICVEFPTSAKDQSSIEWDDAELIFELAQEVETLTETFKQELKKNRLVGGIEKQ